MINPDAVEDVTLYKGGIPSSYGERISSVMDVRLKEGSDKKFGINGGIGLINSRLTLEGPFAKKKKSTYRKNPGCSANTNIRATFPQGIENQQAATQSSPLPFRGKG